MSDIIPIKDFARMMAKKHADTLFVALAGGDKTFVELADLSTPVAVHDLMKIGEDLKMVKSYYNSKTSHKTFRLEVKGFEVDLSETRVELLNIGGQ